MHSLVFGHEKLYTWVIDGILTYMWLQLLKSAPVLLVTKLHK